MKSFTGILAEQQESHTGLEGFYGYVEKNYSTSRLSTPTITMMRVNNSLA